jgi:DNA topoisomerase-1
MDTESLNNNIKGEIDYSTTGTTTTGTKYGKLLEAVKQGKKANRILKVLQTTTLGDILQVYKWWEEAIDEDEETKWKNLTHNGLLFTGKYEPHEVKMKYKGQEISLTPEQEEIATFWAQILDNDLSSKEITRNNYLKEFKKVMGDKYSDAKLDDFDFSPIHQHILKIREKNRNKTSEEKKLEKEKKQALLEYYGYAVIDGRLEKISNYMVEPPGIFRGRGEHPLSGSIKARILPENVTLNIGADDPVPKCALPGHCWKGIVSNPEGTWLAYYRDEKMDKSNKYIFFAPNSKFKGMNDFKKYEKARKLRDCIDIIRSDYISKLDIKETEDRQLGVATYLIDKLALRVGNEKGDDEADTVGCCSLRVEHIKLDDDSHIILDFLGKDSMRYYNRIQVSPKIHANLAKFIKGKNGDDDLFDLINVSILYN